MAEDLVSGLAGVLLERGLPHATLTPWSSVHELYRMSLIDESTPPVADTGQDKWFGIGFKKKKTDYSKFLLL